MRNFKNLVYTVKKYIRVWYMINIETHHIKNSYTPFMINEK